MSDGRFAARGFTLIELLVVVVIIGILATFATLSIGNRALDDRMEMESKRLDQLFQLASDEAQIKGIDIGFRQTATGYQFLSSTPDGKWTPYDPSGPLRDRPIAAPFYLVLSVEDRSVSPPETQGDKTAAVVPQILFLSSGEATAFTIEIHASGYAPYYRIAGDVMGQLTLTREDSRQ